MSLTSKVATLAWFLARPSFYPHMVALVGRSLSGAGRHEEAREDATRWAAERAVDKAEALRALGFGGMLESPPTEMLAAAQARVDASGVDMGGPGDLDILFSTVRALAAQKVVESGVAYGWSSLAILAALSGDGRLVSVDMPYPKEGKESFVGIAVPDELKKSWTLVRRPDRNGLKMAIREHDGTIDFAHYDSDKTYRGRMFGFPLLWDALRPGGLFISDDIQDNFAFRDFVAELGFEPVVIESGGKFVGLLRKPE